jgi:hypothetical protein
MVTPYYFRLVKRRISDRIELMKVRGIVAKHFRDPERWSRYFGYVFLPGCFVLVQCCYFFFQNRIVGEIDGREKRETIYASRRLKLGNDRNGEGGGGNGQQ